MQFYNGLNNLVLKRLVILLQVHFSIWIWGVIFTFRKWMFSYNAKILRNKTVNNRN